MNEASQSDPAAGSGPSVPSPAPQSPAISTLAISWMRDLALSVVIAIVVILFLYQPVRVEGTSMKPTLIDEERIFINKFVYRFSDVTRGDVVVFWFPRDTTKSYIKRVIGVPGDTVEVRDGTVFVNSKKLYEPYVTEENRDHAPMEAKELGPDEFFVLGDHRNASNDSRAWGLVPRSYIYGKAVFVYWPLDRMGVLH
jgi:signal peptidase I